MYVQRDFFTDAVVAPCPPAARPAAPGRRQRRGSRNYLSGLAAEESATRHYRDLGYDVEQTRWRGPGGEIDLILRGPSGLIFVEVKSAKCHAAAADSLRPAQLARILTSAECYAADRPGIDMRIDVALVDRIGAVEILENVTMAL